jgi:hypothetical protein
MVRYIPAHKPDTGGGAAPGLVERALRSRYISFPCGASKTWGSRKIGDDEHSVR